MVHYYKQEKEIWKQCAKRMWDLIDIVKFMSHSNVDKVLKSIGLQKPMILTRQEIRTDMPGDEIYTQPWHQDWRYGQGSLNSVTAWILLHNVTVDNGTIEIIPRSHIYGLLKSKELKNPRRFRIIDDRIDFTTSNPVELNAGEAVFFSQFLLHKSDDNSSNNPRITTQLRFTDYAEKNFMERGYPVADSSELLYHPTEDIVKNIFQKNKTN